MGTLYIVATPIGNLEDMSMRALRVLREVSLIAAEDTRQTRKLLSRYEIENRLVAYHEHNKLARLDQLLLELVDGDVALVSDAGTPVISDPGLELVRTVIEAGFPVVPVPGPCAAIAGLIVSGLATERFYYLGFLPRRSVERQALFHEISAVPATLVFYETPHRLLEALEDALAVLGNRQAAVARELTKLHEQTMRGSLSDLRAQVDAHGVRGEIVLLIAGAAPARNARQRSQPGAASSAAPDPNQPSSPPSPEQIRARLRSLRAEGVQGTHAAKQVAREWDLDRQDVYRLWTELDAEQP